jgi:diacylglycerol O-acyltransferase / wax synthase
MRRLSGFDTAALALETDATPLHMMAVLLLDTSALADGNRYEEIRAFLSSRIHVVPPLLLRLQSVPGAVHRPVWIEAGELDWDYHVPRTILTEPVGIASLNRVAADLAAARLDRDRPLWQMHVIEGPNEDRVAIIACVHHALMDGLGGMEFMSALFDLTPSPLPRYAPRPELPNEEPPSTMSMLRDALVELPNLAVNAGRFASDTLRGLANRGPRDEPVDDEERTVRPFTAPRTPFNQRITPAREVMLTELPLDTIRAVRARTGAKINDVVLAVVSGALRTFLQDRDLLPDKALVAGVPAATSTATELSNNALSFLFLRLATEFDDPTDQLEYVRRESVAAKKLAGEVGMSSLAQLLDTMTPLPIDGALALYRSILVGRVPPIWNVIVSNVPGPPIPLYVAGARLIGIFPLGPIYEGLGLNITVLSRERSLDVGIVSCRDLLSDLDDLGKRLAPALDDLAVASGVTRDSSPR